MFFLSFYIHSISSKIDCQVFFSIISIPCSHMRTWVISGTYICFLEQCGTTHSPAVFAFFRLYRSWVFAVVTPNDFFPCSVYGSESREMAHIRLKGKKQAETAIFTIMGKFRQTESILNHFRSYLAYYLHISAGIRRINATFVPCCHFSCYFGRII
jgi:hypothetical protein